MVQLNDFPNEILCMVIGLSVSSVCKRWYEICLYKPIRLNMINNNWLTKYKNIIGLKIDTLPLMNMDKITELKIKCMYLYNYNLNKLTNLRKLTIRAENHYIDQVSTLTNLTCLKLKNTYLNVDILRPLTNLISIKLNVSETSSELCHLFSSNKQLQTISHKNNINSSLDHLTSEKRVYYPYKGFRTINYLQIKDRTVQTIVERKWTLEECQFYEDPIEYDQYHGD